MVYHANSKISGQKEVGGVMVAAASRVRIGELMYFLQDCFVLGTAFTELSHLLGLKQVYCDLNYFRKTCFGSLWLQGST